MDWIQQWQSKLNKQNGVAPLVRTGGSRHTGLAAPPHRNIQYQTSISDIQKSFIQIKCSKQEESKKVQIPAHPTTHSAKN